MVMIHAFMPSKTRLKALNSNCQKKTHSNFYDLNVFLSAEKCYNRLYRRKGLKLCLINRIFLQVATKRVY